MLQFFYQGLALQLSSYLFQTLQEKLCRQCRRRGCSQVGWNHSSGFEAEAVFDQEFINAGVWLWETADVVITYQECFATDTDRNTLCYRTYTGQVVLLHEGEFSHLAWVQIDRKSGGFGDLNYPLISDITKSISNHMGGLFIKDEEGAIEHSTINNFVIGRSIDETMRTLQVSLLCGKLLRNL
ncbi:hypothetical protein LUZ61_004156 [Rhynchospora tenuis]|uniref:Uncharacterized protein n=1 Tax=Rhynchospora tenuis TaxID=198213 RepID=A0AAD6ETH4_9POAL|nr:hypothetical protein LUZ61_004156 [Rhynchospora tenuis]